MKKLLLLLTFLIPLISFGQIDTTVLSDRFTCFPENKLYGDATQQEILNTKILIKERKEERRKSKGTLQASIVQTPKIIPVVFNMIEFSEGQYSNIGEAVSIAESYVEELNNYFQNGGGDPSNGIYNQSASNFHFVLTNLAEDCQSDFQGVRIFDFADYADSFGLSDWTEGPVNIDDFPDLQVVNAMGYNPDKYLNFYWVDVSYGQGLLGGWSWLPTSNNPVHRGVFMHDYYWDHPSIERPVQIMAHEAGHFFGLPHTFSGHSDCASATNEGDCNIEGDGICDTPPTVKQQACAQPCPLIEADLANFMSYSRDACGYFGFTDEQIEQMHVVADLYKGDIVQQGIDCYGGSGGPGCTDQTACNFNPFSSSDDGSCVYKDAAFVCGGDCTENIDEDFICDDIDNCTDQNACNYSDISNEICKYLDACGVCDGPGEIYECGCYDVVPPLCDCSLTSGYDFNGDGVCDDAQVYPAPTQTPQVSLGECPDPVDLVLWIDVSGSVATQHGPFGEGPLTTIEAAKTIVNYFYPAIINESMRIGFAIFGGEKPIDSDHIFLNLVTGESGWSILNNGLDYLNNSNYLFTAPVGLDTSPTSGIYPAYHIISNELTFLDYTQKALIGITDGEWVHGFENSAYDLENIVESIQNGTFSGSTQSGAVEGFLYNSVPNSKCKMAGIVVEDPDWTNEERATFIENVELISNSPTDVYSAINVENLLSLFEGLDNSVCQEDPVCTFADSLKYSDLSSIYTDTLAFNLPELFNIGTIDYSYDFYQISNSNQQEWNLTSYVEEGQSFVEDQQNKKEYKIPLSPIVANNQEMNNMFRVELIREDTTCVASINVDCNGPFFEDIWPTVPYKGNSNFKQPPLSTNSLGFGYYSYENKVRLPYFVNGRYYISKVNESGVEELYQEIPINNLILSQDNYSTITSLNFANSSIGYANNRSPYYLSIFDVFSYQNSTLYHQMPLDNYVVNLAELDLSTFMNSYNMEVEKLKLYVSPYGKLTKSDSNFNSLECEYSVIIPSCEEFESSIEIKYSDIDDEYFFYYGYSNPEYSNNLPVNDIFTAWDSWIQTNSDIYQSIGLSIGQQSFDMYAENSYFPNNVLIPDNEEEYHAGNSGFVMANYKKIIGLKAFVEANPNQQIVMTVTNPYGCQFDVEIVEPPYNPCEEYAGVTLSYNGNDYNPIPIGNRCWFDRELRTEMFQNLDDIEIINDSLLWAKAEQPYRTTPTPLEEHSYEYWGDVYANQRFRGGYLYNWYVVNDSRNVCPSGWHVSNNSDWNDLEKTIFNARSNKTTFQSNSIYRDSTISMLDSYLFLGIESDIYPAPSEETMTSTGLLGGIRVGVDGTFRESRTARYWWVAEEYPAKPLEFNRQKAAWARGIKIVPDANDPSIWDDSEDGFTRSRDLWSTSHNKSNGLYIRCVKDLE